MAPSGAGNDAGTAMKTIRGWRNARATLERWRRTLVSVSVRLRTPRVIDALSVDFITGEPVEHRGDAKKKFSGKLIYFTADDVVVRRPSGALLVIDTYEIEWLAARGTRVIP